jgi:hypothetical protein
MKRRTLRGLAWVGVALCLVALALGTTVRVLDALPGVTEANLRRVQEGMTLAEVEGLFGRAADQCADRCHSPLTDKLLPRGVEMAAWWNKGDGYVLVWLDGAGRVLDKDGRGLREVDGPLDRLRSLLGR